MTLPSQLDQQQINLLTALHTVYSKHGDPEAYVSQANQTISQIEHDIIETCSKNRIRIDDNLYALLESRDTIAEHNLDLDSALDSASRITHTVDHAVNNLSNKMRVRQNLDAALAIAAQTRKLTRMYARIEDIIDSRRLYTALRMLKVLEEETRCVKPGTVLQQLVPDCHRLRSTIVLHARKAFHSWLAAVRKSETALGAYALYYENKQALSRQQLVSASRLGVLNDTYSLGYAAGVSRISSDIGKDRPRSRPWTPLLSASPVSLSGALLQRGHHSSSLSSHRIGVMSPVQGVLSPETTFRPEIGGDRLSTMRVFASEYKDEVPMLHLRPLLQSVLVNDGLDLLGDMRADYRRERHAHLKKILDEAHAPAEEGGLPARESTHQIGAARARGIEAFVFRMCGFFVVERAVETHTTPVLLPRSVVDFEWWAMAFQRVQCLLKEQEDAAMHSPADKTWARSLQTNLERFAQANQLACRGCG